MGIRRAPCRRLSYLVASLSGCRFPARAARLSSTLATSNVQLPDLQPNSSNLFNYTSGRWLYNERLRLRERRRVFNVNELKRLAAESVSRKLEDVVRFEKLGEGGANRAFLVEMRDGFRLVARIPYPVTAPKRLVVASEAATMTFLRSKGIPVPEVYGYSASENNGAGTEYIFMEFSHGRHLSEVWCDMNVRQRANFCDRLVGVEARLFSMTLPASGSLYFLRDLSVEAKKVAVDVDDATRPDSIYIGPGTSLGLWFGKRSNLKVHRGPFVEAGEVLTSGAKKEIAYLREFGRPMLPFDRIFRETFRLEKQSPSVHLNSLEKYLKVAKHLIPSGRTTLHQPIIRHPDLRPSNIFVTEHFKISSIIDWQHSLVLPLFLQSGIPEDLDNSGDPVSLSLEVPRLPENCGQLEDSERQEQLDLHRARQLHFFYMGETAKQNPAHWEALTSSFSIGRRKLFQESGHPWQGDNIPLRKGLVHFKQHWQELCGDATASCPIDFIEAEEKEVLQLDQEEKEVFDDFQTLKTAWVIGPEGWVPSENYEAVKEATSGMKAEALKQADTDMERMAVEEHWVFDDMDEEEYW